MKIKLLFSLAILTTTVSFAQPAPQDNIAMSPETKSSMSPVANPAMVSNIANALNNTKRQNLESEKSRCYNLITSDCDAECRKKCDEN